MAGPKGTSSGFRYPIADSAIRFAYGSLYPLLCQHRIESLAADERKLGLIFDTAQA